MSSLTLRRSFSDLAALTLTASLAFAAVTGCKRKTDAAPPPPPPPVAVVTEAVTIIDAPRTLRLWDAARRTRNRSRGERRRTSDQHEDRAWPARGQGRVDRAGRREQRRARARRGTRRRANVQDSGRDQSSRLRAL